MAYDKQEALDDIDRVLRHRTSDSGDLAQYYEERVLFLRCIERWAPPASAFRTMASRVMALLGHPDANPIGELRGVLGALRADIDAGQLLPFSQRVRAEVFSDLLGQAGYLNGEGYHRAACVLAGAVLEDHLKHLAVRHNIPVTTSTGKPRQAADINTDLMKPGGAYGKPEWAMVAAWQQSRNQAAHGDPDFDKAHDHAMVHRMIDGVRSFVSKYPV